jgi:hypothetical protein
MYIRCAFSCIDRHSIDRKKASATPVQIVNVRHCPKVLFLSYYNLVTVPPSLTAAITSNLMMAEPQAEDDDTFRGDAYCDSM